MIALTKRKRNRRTRRSPQSLRFTPYAWAKLLFLRDIGETEVGGFGISNPHDLLLIEDFVLIEQISTMVTVDFKDDAVAEFFENQVDEGRTPEQFGRIWIHTHPGSCPRPSGTDESTFERVFGTPDWAMMFILAREGDIYTRLQFNVGPETSKLLKVEIDYQHEFPATDQERWMAEYEAAVHCHDPFSPNRDRNLLAESEADWAEYRACDPYWMDSEWVAS